MKFLFKTIEENFESFAPPENYRFRKSIAGEYRPTAEYLEWASKNLDVWKKFLDNLTAPIAENYPAPKQGQQLQQRPQHQQPQLWL